MICEQLFASGALSVDRRVGFTRHYDLAERVLPDDVIGEAFVVKSSKRASLALVTEATTELLIGDRFRNAR